MRSRVVVREGEKPRDSCNTDDYQRMDLVLIFLERYGGDSIVEDRCDTDDACQTEELVCYTDDVIPSDLVRPPVKAFVPAVDLDRDESSARQAVQADLYLYGGIACVVADHVSVEEGTIYKDQRAYQKDFLRVDGLAVFIVKRILKVHVRSTSNLNQIFIK